MPSRDPELKGPAPELDVWGDLDEDLQVIEEEVAACGENDGKRLGYLLFEMGRLQAAAGDEPAAAQSLLRSYGLLPRFRLTLRLAQRLYRKRGDFPMVIKLLDAEARASRRVHTRVALMRRQAQILWCQMNQVGEARRVLQAAGRLDSGDLACLRLLSLLHAAEGDLDGLRTTLEQELSLLHSPRLRAALGVALALLRSVSDPSLAIKTLQAAVELDPESPGARCHLERLLETEGRHHEWIALLCQRAPDPGLDPPWRAALLARAGRGARDLVDDPGQAASLLLLSLRAHPSPGTAVDAFELLLRVGRHPEAIETGEVLLKLCSSALHQVAWACDLGDLCRQHLQDPAAARRWYLSCLQHAPTYLPALEALGQQALMEGELSVSRMLLETELAVQKRPRARARLLFCLGELLERTGQATEATDLYAEALAADPGHTFSVLALERLLLWQQRWTDLSAHYELMLRQVPEGERALSLREALADLRLRQLAQPDHALQDYQDILGRDPGNVLARRVVARLLAARKDWPGLLQLYDKEERLSQSIPRKVDLLCRCGEIWEIRLGETQQAMQSYKQALDLDPFCRSALQALERLYDRAGRIRELCDLLQAQIQHSEDEERVLELRYRVADLYESRLEDESGAADLYRAILNTRPGELPAAAALGAILARRSRWEQVAQVLSASLEGITDRRSRALRLFAVGTLLEERIGDPQAARARYTQALHLYGELEMARMALTALGGTPEGSGERTTRIKLASPFGTEVPRIDDGPVLHGGPSASGGLPALRARELELRSSSRQRELDGPLRARIELAQDPLELSCLWLELAEVHLLRHEEAMAELAFRKVLEQMEGHPVALWGLGRLLERQERWPELAQLLESGAQTLRSSSWKIDSLLRASVVWEQRVADTGQAERLAREVLRLDPLNEEAFERVATRLREKGDFTGLASLLRLCITAAPERGRSVRLLLDLARIYIDNLGQQGKGLACLQRAAELEPQCQEALALAGEIHFDRGEWSEAENMLCRCLPLVADPTEQVQLHRRLGEIYLQLDRPRVALESFSRAADRSPAPDPSLLQRMVQAAEAAGDPRPLIEALWQLSERVEDPAQRMQIFKEVAQRAEEIEDDERSITALEAVLDLAPLDIEAIERLAATYGRKEEREATLRHLADAVARHRAALRQRPFDRLIHRNLGRIFHWQRHYDALYCTAVVRAYLESLGGEPDLEESERHFLDSHRHRCEPVPTGPISRAGFNHLLLPAEATGPLRETLAAARRTLLRRIAASPESLGLDPDSIIAPAHPLRVLCDEIAQILGGVTFDLFISSTRPRLIAAEVLARPSLILGFEVAKSLITARERFAIGRALFFLANNALVLHDISFRRMQVLLSALGRVAEPACEVVTQRCDPVAVAEEASRLDDLLGDEERLALGAVLPSLRRKLTSPGLALFKQALRFGANRTGLVASGDPVKGLEEAARLTGEQGGGAEIGDLLQFVVSETHLSLRVSLGLAPTAAR